ncbi:Inner membrane protein ypdA [uncultured Blautia sp.]|uniref:cache domain-containing sensor histidine kinase n=1 Tax=Blautia TaxID=572511 RepID=UPI0008221C20|nr:MULTISPECIES: sensor histidine kinase [Blautia]MCU6773574.1 sensor histidine kinase [Blautia acetigignens]NSL02807.1 sensor histidine kinase [Blautia glucerasea]SCH07384.1 Inner membrane protein ypdA [uncultured Blautia sp.]
MKLKYRFFLIFSALAVVPLFLFSYIAYNHYINLSNSQITETSSKIMEQAVQETDSVFGSMQHILELVQYTSPNEETILQELGKFADPNSEHSDQDIYEANKKMKYIFQNFVFSTENINGIFIFTPSKVVLGQGYGNGVDVRSDYDPAGEDWYEKTLELEGKIYVDGVKERDYLLNDTPSISFSMCVYDVYSRDFLGVLYINCSQEIFSLDTVNVLPEATEFVIKRENEILYKSNPFDWENSSETNKESHKIEYNQEIAGEGVTLTAVFDKAGLAADFRVTLSLMLFALVVFLILFIVLAYFLARYLTEPITALSHIMAHPREKNRAVESPYMNRTDEIGTLYNQYQTMLEENNRYIKSEYENKMILMDTQMKALESQINAHFLYNTLEAINSLAEIEEAEDISVMALALGDMFRYSIKTKGALVTLEKELAHVKNFVAIQQIRFDNGFRFEMDVPEELYSCRILKLILQPLVENALYHGLLHCNAGSSIYLSARKENKIIYFTVKDDGVGMASETLEQLQKLLEEKPKFGELSQHANESIGLKNINARIRLYYGEDYGLSVKSEQRCGTTVQIKIPDLAEETKEEA